MQAAVVSKPTTPFEGQKTGTSGLRKKTQVVMQENYLANWIQSLFMALEGEAVGKTMGLGGDGRYFNKEAVQIILKLAAGAPLVVSLSLFLELAPLTYSSTQVCTARERRSSCWCTLGQAARQC